MRWLPEVVQNHLGAALRQSDEFYTAHDSRPVEAVADFDPILETANGNPDAQPDRIVELEDVVALPVLFEPQRRLRGSLHQ